MNAKSLKKPMKIDMQKLKLIHVARRQVGLTDLEYRSALESVGVKPAPDGDCHASDLYLSQFHVIMEHFERLGFISKNSQNPPRPPFSKGGSRPANSHQAVIRSLMEQMGLTDAYVNALARSIARVNHWTWAQPADLGKIIAALKYHEQRLAKKEGRP